MQEITFKQEYNFYNNYYFEEIKYYKVIAKCGHTGKNNYTLYTFPIKAINGKEAAYKVRNTPRVKHHHIDAIRDVTLINYDEYLELLDKCHSDPWYHCESIQDQKRLCPDIIVYREKNIREETRKKNLMKRNDHKDYFEKMRRDNHKINQYESHYSE